VLAAGEGTRMRSAIPKPLHAVAGQSILSHVLAAVRAAGGTSAAVVVGPGHEAIAAEARRVIPAAAVYVQAERRGTAHAVLAAKAALAKGADDVLVIFADTPLVKPQTLRAMRAPLARIGLPARRSDRIWPPGHKSRQALGDPGRARRQ
jgi:bifunctional UDP-N-acetylglucosamine pyrophosphorylase/glucosamine-1-phosphate N-acetyltransferase